jgi:hypothetical protein
MTHDLLSFAWLRRSFGATALCVLLAACGGGGGGGGDDAGPVLVAPPSTAATLTQSSADAMAGVQALNTGAAAVVSKSAALDAGSLFAPVGASASPLGLRGAGAREQALARETVGCGELGFTGCSGSVTFDFNFDANAAILPAGSYFALTFNNLSGSFEGSAFSMSGTLRTDFVTAIDTQAPSLANAQFRVTLDGLSGTADGVSFGPESDVALYEFDAAGVPTITIDGLRLSGLDGLNVTDADNYIASGTQLRFAHWTAVSTYIDIDYNNWAVSAGRPTLGSTAALSAGTSGGATVTVTSSSPSQVVYRVDLNVGGNIVQYLVTADYSSGTPSYSVVAAPT